MEKALISACLAGDKTRYDGKDNLHQELIEGLMQYYDLVLFCPEVEGGLPTPRKKSEIRGDFVVSEEGKDVTNAFTSGAEKALRLCKLFNIQVAILKENSPSCGVSKIHNGRFDGKLIDGQGVTAKLLASHGIAVYSETTAIEMLEEKKRQEQMKNEKTRIRKAKEEAQRKAAEAPVEEEPKEERPARKRFERREPPHARAEGRKPFSKDGKRPFPKRGFNGKPRSNGGERKPRFAKKKPQGK